MYELPKTWAHRLKHQGRVLLLVEFPLSKELGIVEVVGGHAT
jgi:protein-L-isoaspartate O-methyltransferase